jgi:hypothetical protein
LDNKCISENAVDSYGTAKMSYIPSTLQAASTIRVELVLICVDVGEFCFNIILPYTSRLPKATFTSGYDTKALDSSSYMPRPSRLSLSDHHKDVFAQGKG